MFVEDATSSIPLIMRANIKWCRRTRQAEVAAENYICSEFILVITSFSAGWTAFERTNFLREFFFIIYLHVYTRTRIRHINFSSRCSKTVSHMAIISRSLSLDISQTSIFSASRSYSISLSFINSMQTRCRFDYTYTFEGFVSDTIGRVKTDANEKYI